MGVPSRFCLLQLVAFFAQAAAASFLSPACVGLLKAEQYSGFGFAAQSGCWEDSFAEKESCSLCLGTAFEDEPNWYIRVESLDPAVAPCVACLSYSLLRQPAAASAYQHNLTVACSVNATSFSLRKHHSQCWSMSSSLWTRLTALPAFWLSCLAALPVLLLPGWWLLLGGRTALFNRVWRYQVLTSAVDVWLGLCVLVFALWNPHFQSSARNPDDECQALTLTVNQRKWNEVVLYPTIACAAALVGVASARLTYLLKHWYAAGNPLRPYSLAGYVRWVVQFLVSYNPQNYAVLVAQSFLSLLTFAFALKVGATMTQEVCVSMEATLSGSGPAAYACAFAMAVTCTVWHAVSLALQWDSVWLQFAELRRPLSRAFAVHVPGVLCALATYGLSATHVVVEVTITVILAFNSYHDIYQGGVLQFDMEELTFRAAALGLTWVVVTLVQWDLYSALSKYLAHQWHLRKSTVALRASIADDGDDTNPLHVQLLREDTEDNLAGSDGSDSYDVNGYAAFRRSLPIARTCHIDAGKMASDPVTLTLATLVTGVIIGFWTYKGVGEFFQTSLPPRVMIPLLVLLVIRAVFVILLRAETGVPRSADPNVSSDQMQPSEESNSAGLWPRFYVWVKATGMHLVALINSAANFVYFSYFLATYDTGNFERIVLGFIVAVSVFGCINNSLTLWGKQCCRYSVGKDRLYRVTGLVKALKLYAKSVLLIVLPSSQLAHSSSTVTILIVITCAILVGLTFSNVYPMWRHPERFLTLHVSTRFPRLFLLGHVIGNLYVLGATAALVYIGHFQPTDASTNSVQREVLVVIFSLVFVALSYSANESAQFLFEAQQAATSGKACRTSAEGVLATDRSVMVVLMATLLGVLISLYSLPFEFPVSANVLSGFSLPIVLRSLVLRVSVPLCPS